MFFGELAALGTAVCWSGTALFFSYSSRRIGSDVVNRSRLLFALLFLSLTHWLLQGQPFPTHVETWRWGWFAISSLLGLVIGDAFLFRAYVLIGPRMSMLVMTTVPIFSVLFDWLLFHQKIGGWQLAGISLAMAGVAWVVSEKRAEQTASETKQFRQGLLYGLAGALGQVANLVTAKYGLAGGFPTISATWIRILIAAAVLWGLTAVQGELRASFRQWQNREAFPALVAGSVAGPFLGIWLSLTAVQYAPLGIASTLMALPPVLLIPLEYLIERKPVTTRSIVGTVLAFLGVALLFNVSG